MDKIQLLAQIREQASLVHVLLDKLDQLVVKLPEAIKDRYDLHASIYGLDLEDLLYFLEEISSLDFVDVAED